MAIDLHGLTAAADELVDQYLDYHYLNETTQLENPTCEGLVRWIYEQRRPDIKLLRAIIEEETCTARCEYRPEI